MTWKLRQHSVKNKSTGEYERVRENPIRETSWKHDRLRVPKLGEVKIYMHRLLEGDPKEITLVKKASGWYAHISCELPDTPKVEPTDAIAVDMEQRITSQLPKVKKKITLAGIVKSKGLHENILKTYRVKS